jgi:O-antigen/teichoic acid export membrane protein
VRPRPALEENSTARAMGTGRMGAKTKALWTVIDQVVSSGTNAAVNFLIASRVGADEFGAFAIAFTIFAMTVGLSRSATTAPLGISYAGASPTEFRAASRSAAGAALVLGVVCGLPLVLLGVALPATIATNLAAMGLVLPALLVQDAWRYVFFARGRPVAAVVNDLVWAGALAVGFGVLARGGDGASTRLVLLWGAGAAVAALFGVAQTRCLPAPAQALRWVRGHRATTGYMSAEYITVQGAAQTSTLMLGLGSPTLVGALRGLQTLLAPTTNLAVALTSFAIPEFARRRDTPMGARIRAAYVLSAFIVVSSTAWAVAFMVLPTDFGGALLGDTWHETRALLGLATIQQAGPALAIGPAALLYALGKTRLTFQINLFFAPLLLICPLVGEHFGGARGAVIGYIIAFWATIPPWLIQLHRATRSLGTATPRPSREPARST